MLYSVILGNQSTISNDWSVEKDTYGNTFFRNDTIRQKIRVGEKVLSENIKLVDQSSSINKYEMPERTFFSNNNKNMNISLMNFYSKDPKKLEEYKSDNLLFVTINDENYKLMDYDARGNMIMQTYHKKQAYQGCCIKFSPNVTDHEGILIMDLLEEKTGKLVSVEISVDTDGTLSKVSSNIDDLETIERYTRIVVKNKKYQRRFRIEVPVGDLITSTYVTTSENEDVMKDITKNIPNANVIVVDPDNLDENMLKEEITDKRVRAITTAGVKLPKSFCQDYNILYLFEYDFKFNNLKCLKSNSVIIKSQTAKNIYYLYD